MPDPVEQRRLTRESSPTATDPCGYCGLVRSGEGCKASGLTENSVGQGALPDPCLGMMEGVVHACCGHGCVEPAYVVHGPGLTGGESCWELKEKGIPHTLLRGTAAIQFFADRGVGPHKAGAEA